MFSHVCWQRRPGDVQHSFTSVGRQQRAGWAAHRKGGGDLEASSLHPRYKRGLGGKRDPGTQERQGGTQTGKGSKKTRGRGESQ